jgi:hypothetical protein
VADAQHSSDGVEHTGRVERGNEWQEPAGGIGEAGY